MQVSSKKAWFKQFWPWFLILLPLSAVTAGISTLIIAIKNEPEMVVDDYYKTGKAINTDFSLLQQAKERGISAQVKQQQGELLISLTGLQNNASLRLSLFHATQSKRDKSIMLTADAIGNYHYQTEQSLTGKWILRIEPFDKKWRLQKNVQFPTANITI